MNAMRMLVSGRPMSLLMAVLVAALVMAGILLAGIVPGADALTTTMKTCQDNNSTCAIYPFGGWNKSQSGKASGGTYHVSNSTTRAAVFQPTYGPEIDLMTATGPKRGTAKVFVFDMFTGKQVKVVKFNLKAKRSHFKVMKKVTGLRQNRMYTVAVISANGRPIVVDAFKGSLQADGNLQPPEGATPPGSPPGS